MAVSFVKITGLAVVVLAASTEAHNKMTLPVPTWPDGFYNQNSPSGTIDPRTYCPSRATLEGSASNECGFSLVDGTPRDLPDEVQWDFFTASHQGPCEVWCDDTLVFENWNCAVDYPETPANLPYDKAKCKGSSRHVGVDDYESPTTTTATPTVTTAPTVVTTATPTVTSAAQTEASAEEEEAPSGDASTDAEADETEAPATTATPSVDKCSSSKKSTRCSPIAFANLYTSVEMVAISSARVVVLVLAVMAASADAHSKMSLPKPTWVYDEGTNSPAGTVDSSNVLPVPDGMGYEGDPLSNTEAYWTAFNASKYTSLKELVWENEVVNTDSLYGTATIECGFSWTNGTARDLPDEVQWDKLTTGHDGPCEIWCDDTLVFSDQNCAVNYPESPASFPYDKAACEGKSMLTAIWLALHSPPWQVFTNCAPLTGATSSSSDSTTSTSTSTATTPTATTPTSSTKAPSATTVPSSTSAADETDSTAAEEASRAADYDGASTTSPEASTTTDTTATAETDLLPPQRRRLHRRRKSVRAVIIKPGLASQVEAMLLVSVSCC
ncbi:hypothetical protein GQ600_6957 [Phytophthora cactorum]|nr:hypothetical protein GQ600_6957 [Phytophthora cactorum]